MAVVPQSCIAGDDPIDPKHPNLGYKYGKAKHKIGGVVGCNEGANT